MVGSLRASSLVCWRNVWAALIMVVALINIVIYVDIVIFKNPDTGTLPVVQKFAPAFLTFWMTATIIEVLKRRRT